MKHSVILGSFNRPTMVREAIRSVMGQSWPSWQLIVTDDGSTEETLAAIRGELGNDPRCWLFVAPSLLPGPRPNGNVRAVERINDVIPLVAGDIVHYLPDDDWFLPGRFEAFNEVFTDPAVMVACGWLRYADGAGRVSPTEGIFPRADVPDPWGVLDQSQVAHRRTCFEKVPRWSTHNIGYASDGVFYRDLSRAYGPIRAMPAVVSVKRRHDLMLGVTKARATHERE